MRTGKGGVLGQGKGGIRTGNGGIRTWKGKG